ncbi:hypothetical protein [Noviherbaspirillum sedimenti]|uniref:Glycosyltransferase RgtA/B/C/D-like domain-containing protein n=1 Tax=Noviherbaspirillum sedimenti TaxID=2320865 RepID=A0A3A3GPK2_9BURK|nr:hypothetical protein [Noviherbaspirillum sedimenti]RJG02920.1 hypothetical protein D3878_16140 [Noviherbaspirillum sedimenti]
MKFPEKYRGDISSNLSRGLESIAKAGIFLCAIVVIAYCVWALERGFEITDEAYYLLLAMHADSVQFYISAQQWISTWLWQITGSLHLFRAAGMAVLLASSGLLAVAAFSACIHIGVVTDRFQSKAVVVAGSIVGAMLYASTINLSPSYNLLASAGAYAAAGLVLLGVHRSSIIQKHLLFAMAGCAIGLEALCKASAGASTLMLLIIWLCIFERSYFHKIGGTVSMAVGVVAFTGIALLSNTTVSDATQAVEQGMLLFRAVQVESIDVRLIRYAIQFGEYVAETLIAFYIPLFAFSAYAMTRRTVIAIAGLAVLSFTLLSGQHLLGGWSVKGTIAAPIAIFAMLIMALLVSIPVWRKNRRSIALFGGLFFLPYSVAMGTGNTLFTQVIVSLAPWATLVTLLVVAHHPKGLSKIPASVIGFCFIATVSSQIVTSSLQPYNMTTPLTKQDQLFSIGNLGVVKVDAETHKFLADMKAATKECNILPGAPFLGLYNIPGVALALQSVPVMTPWLNNVAQAAFVLERAHHDELHSVVVAVNMGAAEKLPPLPHQLGGFPFGYHYCGTATYPFGGQKIKIWQSLGKR